MSKIQDQIKLLQLKQKKLEYVSYIADLIKNDTKCIDFKDVQTEIVEQVEPFLLDLMTSIENDTPLKSQTKEPDFTHNQIVTLRTVADTILNRPEVTKAKVEDVQPFHKPVQAPTPTSELSPQDKMSFAMDNRHLANKRVQVINDQNVTINGKVVGLDAPHVVVQTDTGPTIKVPLQKVVLS